MNIFDISSIAFPVWNYPISYVELIGVLFGLASVYFASRANILTWPTGIMNEVFLFMLFFQVQLYADMFLQVYFFAATLYGWNRWGSKQPENRISETSFRNKLLIAGMILISTLLSGFLFGNIHRYLPDYFKLPADYPFIDSFIMVSSIAATILLAQKKIETWYLWIAADVVALVIYFQKGVYFLSLEYLIFLGLAIYGLTYWRKQLRND